MNNIKRVALGNSMVFYSDQNEVLVRRARGALAAIYRGAPRRDGPTTYDGISVRLQTTLRESAGIRGVRACVVHRRSRLTGSVGMFVYRDRLVIYVTERFSIVQGTPRTPSDGTEFEHLIKHLELSKTPYTVEHHKTWEDRAPGVQNREAHVEVYVPMLGGYNA